MVVELGEAVFHALAHEGQVGRVGHAFHAAGDHHVGRTDGEHVVGEHHGAHARAAHLGQSDGPGGLRQASFQCSLPRRRLALPRHQAIAHQHFVDGLGPDARPLHCGGDGRCAQFPCGDGGEIAEQPADGGARGGNNHDRVGLHVASSSEWGVCGSTLASFDASWARKRRDTS
ncbi:hypothetical protein GALL_476980 [mine drainage metagenome]|uniref:Uncharacterized protein n=1 Tax=mine drainage metagenome TaxID=410659 RepID=A0A1J5PGX1_9ZZZZ